MPSWKWVVCPFPLNVSLHIISLICYNLQVVPNFRGFALCLGLPNVEIRLEERNQPDRGRFERILQVLSHVSNHLTHEEGQTLMIKLANEGGKGPPKVVKQTTKSSMDLVINRTFENEMLFKLHLMQMA